MAKKPTYQELENKIREFEQVKENLKDSEERFKTIITGNIPITFMFDKDGKILLSEGRHLSSVGLKPGQIVGQNVFEVYSDFPEVVRALRSVLKGGNYNGTIKLGELTFDASFFPDKNPQGDIIGVIGTALDITERVKAETNLKTSLNRHRQMITQSPLAYEVYDKDGTQLLVNKAYEKLWGMKAEDSVGKFNILTDPQVKKLGLLSSVQSAYSGEVVNLPPFKWDPKDSGFPGRHRWLKTTIYPIKDENSKIVNVIITHEDVTNFKNAESDLIKNQYYLTKAQEIGSLGTWELDLIKNELIWTKQNYINFGVPIGTPLTYEIFLNCVHPNDRDYVNSEWMAAVEGKPYDIVHRLIVDGKVRWVREKADLQFDSEGKPVKAIGFTQDITTLKQTEDEKLKLELQLQQAQKMESIGTLAGGIAHNFNNILTSVQGYASLMKMDKSSSHSDFQYLTAIEESVQSAVQLTRQLLGFAQGGKYTVELIDINELLKKESGIFARTKKEIKIQTKFDKKLRTVKGDQGQIQQIILNLLVNASQAMPKGGSIYVETINTTIGKEYKKPFKIKPGNFVKIVVTDTGSGMDKNTQKKAFDPFFTTKGKGIGSGLGLASVYGIVKNHKGFINLYSEKGNGTTFTIYLPASGKNIIKKDKKIKNKILPGEGTILLIDDEKVLRIVGKKMLEIQGYTVLTANSGREAVKLYKKDKNKIDLVILDMIMPEMSGEVTFEKLKEINPQIKVILSSGYSLNGQAEGIIKKGCKGFLQKPFTLSELSEKLKMLL